MAKDGGGPGRRRPGPAAASGSAEADLEDAALAGLDHAAAVDAAVLEQDQIAVGRGEAALAGQQPASAG